jgi:hypothetical protein
MFLITRFLSIVCSRMPASVRACVMFETIVLRYNVVAQPDLHTVIKTSGASWMSWAACKMRNKRPMPPTNNKLN